MAAATSGPRRELLSLPEVAHNFNVSQRTIKRWVARGEFPPFTRSGRQAFWIGAEIVAWFAARRTPSGRRRR